MNRISNEYNETKIWFKLTEFLEFIRKTQYKRRLLEFRDLDLRSKSGLLDQRSDLGLKGLFRYKSKMGLREKGWGSSIYSENDPC